MYVEKDDFRQSYVVAKNEILKFIRGKKFIVYVAIVALVFLLYTILPFITGESFSELYQLAGGTVPAYLSFMNIIVILGATLFASNTIVSEFEERTALVLFTRPIKKTSIFLGKIIGCIIVETVMVVLFYLGTAVVSQLADGFVPIDLFTGLGIAFLFIIASTGIAMLISSILKKSGTSAVLTFFLLLLIIPMISLMVSISGVDPWFMLNHASSLMVPSYQVYTDALTGVSTVIKLPMEHVARATGVLIIWAMGTSFVAWLMFTRREF